MRGRVTNEPFVLSGTQSATYYFDQAGGGPSLENGLGVRTLQQITSTTGYQVNTQNQFKQPMQDLYAPPSSSLNTYNFGYDAAGNVISRSVVGDGTKMLTWDAWGRLAKVSQRNTGSQDYDWTTVYDGLGRRVQTIQQPMNNGVNSYAPSYLQYYYDPQVEFLQLGTNNNGVRTWNIYGPDVDGIYGGQQGTGGLEAFVYETNGSIIGEISNFYGDVIGQTWINSYSQGQYGWWGATLGSYGPLPGSSVNALAPQWRGRYTDNTGFCWMGTRPYDLSSGRFLSPDSLGHGASMSLYDYCAGDGVNRLDPTGRCPFGNRSAGLSSISTQSEPYEQISYTDGAIGNANRYYDQQFSTGLNSFLKNGSFTGLGQALTSFVGSTIIAASPVNGGVESAWQASGSAWGSGNYAAATGYAVLGTLPTALTLAPIIGGEFSAVAPKNTLTLPATMADELPAYLQAADEGLLIKVKSSNLPASNARAIWENTYGPVPEGFDVDHIIQRQFGGTNELSNLQLKASGLNRSQGAKSMWLNKTHPYGTVFDSVKLSDH